jgi:hypothetical protein
VINVKTARVAPSERSRGDASDIDGQTERSKWAGAHESTWERSEFQPTDDTDENNDEIRMTKLEGMNEARMTNSEGIATFQHLRCLRYLL